MTLLNHEVRIDLAPPVPLNLKAVKKGRDTLASNTRPFAFADP
jgi:hypothetical protein